MKLRKIYLTFLCFALVFFACNNDDDDDVSATAVPARDRAEVYAEDLEEIEAYLETHYYNYEDFDFINLYDNVANDNFEIIINEIPEGNPDSRISLLDSPELKFKMVEDSTDETITYKLYYLEVREGSGEILYPSDEAFLTYIGFTITNSIPFDSTVTPVSLNLTTVSQNIRGVVDGFREGLIEFKGSTDYTNNGDGTHTYHNHGIGMIFIPSGLGYFSGPPSNTDIETYQPLIFKINLIEPIHTDFDADNIYSYLEDLDGDNDVFNDDTDSDSGPNFIDNDDDNDGVFNPL